MMTPKFRAILIVGLYAALGASFFVIPLLGAGVFLSPDETANVVAARAFAAQGSLRIEDPILKDAPWMHPRSFVTQGSAMVPVGFLGVPFALGVIRKLFGEWGMVLAVPLLALSAAYPLWRIMRKLGLLPQIITVTTWLTFPTIILYANRAFFPNMPVVALMVWAVYLVWSARTVRRFAFSGFLFGLAAAMRPVELFWMIPWVIAGWMLRSEPRRAMTAHVSAFIFGAVVPTFAAVFVAWRTYGTPFAVGYFLRDPVAVSIGAAQGSSSPTSILSRWPFGFHPRNVWFNVKAYFFGFWAPWSIAAIATFFLYWKERDRRTLLLVSLWTFVAGILVYGQAIYQDHVGVNVASTGNSFLRYLLPLAPLFALAAGGLSAKLFQELPHRSAWLGSLLFAVTLAGCGITIGFFLDGESVFPAATEVQRYLAIKHAATERLQPQTIILSERSDKIFFPAFRVASPLPEKRQIRELVETAPTIVAFFSTTLDERGERPWRAAGLDLHPVFSNQNQTMYILSPSASLAP